MTTPGRVLVGTVGFTRPRDLERFGPAVSESERRAVLDRAREEGRREGLEQAAAELAESQRRVAAALEILARLAGELDKAREVAAEVAGAAVLDLAVELAETVVGRHLEQAACPGADTLRHALAAVASGTRVTARLAPTDLAALHAGGVPEDLDHPVELVSDASLSRGDCLVEAGSTVVDARLAPAIERVRRALQEAR